MTTDGAPEVSAIVLHFPALAWRGRLSAHLRARARPRSLVVLAGLAALPTLVVEAVMPGGALRAFTMALGAGVCLTVVVLGTLAAAVQRTRGSSLVFTEDSIRQDVEGTVRVHGWDWVLHAEEDGEGLTVIVEAPPMRSFRLARPEPEHLLVRRDAVDEETYAGLQALLEAHEHLGGRGRPPRGG